MLAHVKKVKVVAARRTSFRSPTPQDQVFFVQNPALIPKNVQFFESYGVRGWFDQTNKKLGSVTLHGIECDILMLQLWDSHPQGSFGFIVNAAPKRSRPLLNTHFALLNHQRVMLRETKPLGGRLPGNTLYTMTSMALSLIGVSAKLSPTPLRLC